MLKKLEFTVPKQKNKLRLDQILSQHEGVGLSRMRIQKLIKDGFVFMNDQVIRQPKMLINEEATFIIQIPENEELVLIPEPMVLNIFYEDEDLLVLDKPAGLVVHPGNGTFEPTLVHGLLYHCGDSLSGIGGVKRPGIVHRLDKDTSGIMVVAKNDFAHQHLSAQFFDHGRTGVLKRCYRALVWGGPQIAEGRIKTFLGRSKYDRLKRAIVPEKAIDAKEAITHYKVEKFFYESFVNQGQGVKMVHSPTEKLASLITCQLETGRTHQIRVHMAHLGHSLLGDKQYGAAQKSKQSKLNESAKKALEALNRQALHAYFLRFCHPRHNKILEFESPLPLDIRHLLDVL